MADERGALAVGDAQATSSGGLLTAPAPESVGIASTAVLDFVDAVEQVGLDPHSLMLVRHGRVAAAGWWAPYRPDDITLQYSLSKSVTATAVGFAVAEGLIDLDGTLAGYFPDVPAAQRASTIRVRHLLAMSTGHEADTLDRIDPANPVEAFLGIEPDAPPGTLFTYNNGATLMLAVLLTERTGQDIGDYLRPRLLDPLGIDRLFWRRWGTYQQGFSGLHLATGAIARLGQVYLDGGAFGGRAVLPGGWAALASQLHTPNADRAEVADWQQGYGFGFWRSRHGFRGDGAVGQFCLMLPEQDLVLAATGAMADMQGYLDRVWAVLLPGVADREMPANPSAAARLADRLASLSLPLPVDGAAGPASGASNTPSGSSGTAAEMRLTGRAAATLELTHVRLDPAADGWLITLGDADGARYPVPVTAGTFVRGEHRVGERVLTLAGSGGWDDGRFLADIVLVNTPHRFRLTADPRTGTAQTSWHIEPLHPMSLADRAIPALGG